MFPIHIKFRPLAFLSEDTKRTTEFSYRYVHLVFTSASAWQCIFAK